MSIADKSVADADAANADTAASFSAPRGHWRHVAVVVVVAAGLFAFARSAAAWETPPVPVLDWQPCTGAGQKGFDCATAQVPLDYRAVKGETIELAVIRHKAEDQAHRLGSLFFNPGGPGAPGTAILPLAFTFPVTPAPLIFPLEVRKRFDIISWDPRGVGNSAAILCWDKSRTINAEKEAAFLSTLTSGVPYTDAEQRAWIDGWAHIANQCRNNAGKLLDHVSTTEDARDLDLLRQAVGDKQLSYQGNSYGTFLGAVYANLFPDRVRAMALVGNMNAPARVDVGESDPLLNNGLRQQSDVGSHDTLKAFLSRCGEVPKSKCAFSAGSAAATRQKWETLLERVNEHPITVGKMVWNHDVLVSYSVVLLYKVSEWPAFACSLEQAWEGNANACITPAPAPVAMTGSEESVPGQVASQLLAINCGETPNPRTVDGYLDLIDIAQDRSGAVGAYWVWLDESCHGWPGHAADSYTGPWDRHTANPVLLINNLADPATPYQNAVIMAHTLADARLITVKGYGHADGGDPSTCVNDYLVSYFVDGKAPPKAAVCGQDLPPFP